MDFLLPSSFTPYLKLPAVLSSTLLSNELQAELQQANQAHQTNQTQNNNNNNNAAVSSNSFPFSPFLMSVLTSMSDYLVRALSSCSGMKALLFDGETASMFALVVSQTEIIQKEVFMTENIEAEQKNKDKDNKESDSKEQFHHLKAIVLLRPSLSSIEALKRTIRSGKFKDYYVFFTNFVSDEYLRNLAEGDEYECIRQVQELYGDYYSVNDSLWHINIKCTKKLYQNPATWLSDTKRVFDRHIDSLLSILLSMKRRPDIRYQGSSELCKMLAQECNRRIRDENDLFTFQNENPLMLILDRRDDPVTPLLSQWTYQAMIHDLIGIDNNRVSLRAAPGIRKELVEVVLNAQQDHFFRGSMYLNFGDLGTSIKDLVQNYQRKTQNHAKLDSVEDMQRFVDNYPEFRAMSGTVSKHVAIVTELSRLVNQQEKMKVSELEQELACNQDHSTAMDALLKIMEDHKVEWNDKLKLVLLYSLRYEMQKHQIPQFKQILRAKAGSDFKALQRVAGVDEMLKCCGAKQRGGDLFGNKTLLSMAEKWVKSGLKGVENIYTQHKPQLAETLNLLSQNKLKNNMYPFVDSQTANNASKARYRLIFVFMVGGATYEEAAAVEAFNNANVGTRVILGGSYIHNSKSFIQDLLSDNEGQHSIDIE